MVPIIDSNYYVQVSSLPRQMDKTIEIDNKRWREAWLHRNSMFKVWVFDHNENLDLLFESDFSQTSLPSFIPDELDLLKVKEYLKKHY
jgi:hypothetical protein